MRWFNKQAMDQRDTLKRGGRHHHDANNFAGL
jgi:hypothetical protein